MDILTSPELAIRSLLDEMRTKQASDLHISVGQRPMLRLNGDLVASDSHNEPLTPQETEALALAVLEPAKRTRFASGNAIDFAFSVEGLARYRGNVFRQRGAVSCAIRAIPLKVQPLAELALPSVIGRIADKERGLVLVTGPTGSGKSTTLAAMLDKINRNRAAHILTLEDPIEHIHVHQRSLVNQREIGTDVDSFAEGLRSALREDPDVILVGEMRDLETISAALTIAETGHLCLATMHSHSAPEAINRIIDSFPHEQHAQIRQQLAATLEAVITQDLVPVDGGRARVACCEILIANNAVQAAIREQKTAQIVSIIQTGSREGMQSMNTDLYRLVEQKRLSPEDAVRRSPRWQELSSELQRGGFLRQNSSDRLGRVQR